MSDIENEKPENPKRRQFFSRSAASALSVAGGATLFSGLVATASAESGYTGFGPGLSRNWHGWPKGRRGWGYGKLSPAGDHLALPPGFQYSVVSMEGDLMADGYPAPKAMDGMGAFPLPNGNVLLIRNHEDTDRGDWFRPRPAGSTSTSAGILNEFLNTHYGPRGGYAYDEFAGGGTTSLEVEPWGRRRLVRQWWSLTGTKRNCSGGVTPWGSWLTGEETLEPASTANTAQDHGYVFEVPVNTTPGNPLWQPQPIRQMGRFNHEVSAVDPVTGIVYLTEDSGDNSGLYRFVPDTKPTAPGQLGTSILGTLQMLRVADTDQYVTAIGQTVGTPLAASWVTIANPDAGANPSAVFNQGLAAGGARFRRLEGAWFGKGKLYFASTNGGDSGLGQIWVHDPVAATVTLLFESDNVDVMDACDNITVTPRGGLIVCEDNGGMQFLRGITPTGEIFDFAKNIFNNIEFAGAVFSPDGQTLFVNLFGRLTTRTLTPYVLPGPVTGPTQTPIMGETSEQAMTLAIWGPWRSGYL